MNVIVGSTALAHFKLNRKEPVDHDVWTDEEKIPHVDSYVIPSDILSLVRTEDGFATPDSCYTIKCSHAQWDIKWEKTKLDILWLKAKGCKIIPDLYKALVIHWKSVHGNKSFLSLVKSKKDFFNDHVTYVQDHDYLHSLVSFPNEPMYNRVLTDGQEVLIDREKFEALPLQDKVRLFREEITVIAIERWVINPQNTGKISWFRAYHYALRKTVTSLTKNWASEFIILNIEHFNHPDFSYFKHPLQILEK